MRNLFRPPSEALARDLESAMRAVATATPISKTHERELPYAVRDLSRLLTQDRSQLARSYWINKRLLTAYCRYFLPWNLVRLSWLLPGLDLPLKPGGTILDLGSGPLTLPLALWLAKPEWRDAPLTVICCDIAAGPLELGRDIFRLLTGDSPWTIDLRRGPMDGALRSFSGGAMLVSAVNVLNEYKPSRETSLEDRLAAFTRLVASRLAPDGRFLAVEPGTRLGGKLMAQTRRAAFAAQMAPEAPCPHWDACPMLAERATGWCHFSHTTAAAPRELTALTRRAKLDKDGLSLSCLLLRRAGEDEKKRTAAFLPPVPEDEVDEFDDEFNEEAPSSADAWAAAFAALRRDEAAQNVVRILSDPIRLPDDPAPARYGCSCKGLVLVRNALRMPSGAAFAVRWPQEEMRDAKSGALVVAAPEAATGKTSGKPFSGGSGKEPGTSPGKFQGKIPRKPSGEPSRKPRRNDPFAKPENKKPGERVERSKNPTERSKERDVGGKGKSRRLTTPKS